MLPFLPYQTISLWLLDRGGKGKNSFFFVVCVTLLRFSSYCPTIDSAGRDTICFQYEGNPFLAVMKTGVPIWKNSLLFQL